MIIQSIIIYLLLSRFCFNSKLIFHNHINTRINHDNISTSLNLRTHSDKSEHYELKIMTSSNKTCLTTSQNKTRLDLPVSSERSNMNVVISNDVKTVQLVNSEIGPDEILIEIEGVTLQTFIPKYLGCGRYEQIFYIYDSGLYHIKVFRMRSKYQAIQEAVVIYPRIEYEILANDWIYLNESKFKSSRNQNCAYQQHTNQGIWRLIPDYVSSFPTDIDVAKSSTPMRLVEKTWDVSNVKKTVGLYEMIDLPVEVHVNISSKLDGSCVYDVDLYSFQPLPTQCMHNKDALKGHTIKPTWDYISSNDTHTILKNKKINIKGDSHARMLTNHLLERTCGVPINMKNKHPQWDTTVGSCDGINVEFHPTDNCDQLLSALNLTTVGDAAKYDLVIINCGQHEAASPQEFKSAAEYDKIVSEVMTLVMQKGYRRGQLYWIETVPLPLRQDGYTIGATDRRTISRLRLYNIIADFHVQKNDFLTIKSFYPLLPLFDKICDAAHYVTTNAYDPILQQIYHILSEQNKNTKPPKLA